LHVAQRVETAFLALLLLQAKEWTNPHRSREGIKATLGDALRVQCSQQRQIR
jgi:hypothetical protein